MAEREVLTENDGDEDARGGGTNSAQQPQQRDEGGLPEGLTPVRSAPIKERPDREAEPEYVVVETDEQGRELGGGQGRQADETLQAHEGQDTELDRQRRERGQQGGQPWYKNNAERRRAQRDAKRRGTQAEAENALLRQQVAELSQRVDGFQPHLQRFDASQRQSAIATLDGQIREQEQALARAEDRVSEAISRIALGEEGAKEELKKAQRDAFTAVSTGQRLVIQKTNFERSTAAAQPGEDGLGAQREQQPGRQQAQQPQQRPLSRDALENVQDFAARHEWFDPKGGDATSKLVLLIDAEVSRDGFRPETPDYWDELEARLEEVIPHKMGAAPAPAARNGNGAGNGNGAARTQRQAAVQPQRRGPMTASGEGGRQSDGRVRVLVTPGRKQAMIDAGVVAVDGKVINKPKFERMKKAFADFDADVARSA